MTPDNARHLRRAARRAAEATTERDRLIREARVAGDSLRAIAAEVGLSHSAVKKIAER